MAQFGFLLDAFKYGVPPHGGLAFGLDRMVMLFSPGQEYFEMSSLSPKFKNSFVFNDRGPAPVAISNWRIGHFC